LVGVYRSKRDLSQHQASIAELHQLAETAGAVVVGQSLTETKALVPATYIGKGKVEDIAQEVKRLEVNLVLFDEELSPAQNRNLEDGIGCKVIDRSGLILDIFAQRARSREGQLQVELAQLHYLLPRLVGRGGQFSQLAGGIGTRGPGETRLEM